MHRSGLIAALWGVWLGSGIVVTAVTWSESHWWQRTLMLVLLGLIVSVPFLLRRRSNEQ